MHVPMDYADRSVCVIGLGYVGLTLAASLADVGFDVWGVEIRDDVLAGLAEGRPHFFEPGLPELLDKAVRAGRLRFAKNVGPECRSRVYIITVGTPLDGQRRSRMDMIASVSGEVAQVLRAGDMVVARSTVKIGTTRGVISAILGRTGLDYDLAFCPERTLEGQALPELRQLPQIVGAASERANLRAARFFQFLTPSIVRVGSLETAETIKLVDNAQRDVSFAFANEVARVSDAVGVSAAEVIGAGKLGYARTNLPMPGPVGGPCLEKDSYILAESVEAHGIQPDIALAARRLNENQPAEAIAFLERYAGSLPGFPAAPAVTVAGVAFKGRPATDDLRGTMAVPIIRELKARFPGARLRGYDAVVAANDIAGLGLEPETDMTKAFAGANLVVIANNHPCFSETAILKGMAGMARPGAVYDFWNNLRAPGAGLPDDVRYVALGSHGLAPAT
jgi:UDP-N-acetyl-D-mannosaminuronic acid dehydrogenase